MMTDNRGERHMPEDLPKDTTVAICSRYIEGQLLNFLDDQFGHCEHCQHAIHFRPSIAWITHKICLPCALEKFRQLPEREQPEIRVLPSTIDDLKGHDKATGA